MFVDILQRGVFEGFIGALLGFPFSISYRTDLLDDLDAGELFRIRPFEQIGWQADGLRPRRKMMWTKHRFLNTRRVLY
jgi:hypothetical protein